MLAPAERSGITILNILNKALVPDKGYEAQGKASLENLG